ncbi:cytosolic endo-beta-N-acetylglucosaminidase isoform 1 [Danaus plexippus plexippus]|uniref:Cytosolic endo-beta-N-acetylglucosaminidase isoform 1 n=1 Tax=Danaus plexippus plexippus TaxID=278856 RepID=A0A212FF69_DANPL|nr:cytosolic endo-beta-N-acetylglucosaminidase isoform 1 [Danaus plexippus plexippus]
MANGYHDDSFIDGTGNYTAYTFYNWGGIDIFCYFSHHFITIPPLGWINVAHAHGVQIIGTVITEWADGVAMWEKLLSSESEWQDFASMLVAIAKTLKFDGWLLNIENKVSDPRSLVQFVHHLHTALHQELPHAVLLWYDSVTVDGHLYWQNALNEKNRAFFDVTDGLFTNYSWSASDVSSSVLEAGDRLTDLYIGIDVWGRNFYGGGQFNTQQAIQVAFHQGCSLAIFAPAWTYEALTNDKDNLNWVTDGEELDGYDSFLLRDRALWTSLWPFLNTKLPCRLPFQTSWCRGQGTRRRIYGEVICPVPWYNLRHMHYQPNSTLGPHGYLLSTQDNINRLSNLGLLKNREGILRYRKSLEQSKMELETNPGDVAMNIKEDSLTHLDSGSHREVVVDKDSDTSTVRTTVRTKVKNALRNLFKIRTSRVDKNGSDHVSQASDRTDEAAREAEEYQSSGKSMVRMSLNLSLGRTTKTRYCLGYVSMERECFETYYEDSFIGGSCLMVHPADDEYEAQRTSRLLHCDFRCDDTLVVCVVTKTLDEHDDQFLNIRLSVSDCGGCEKVVLVGRSLPSGGEEPSGTELEQVFPVNDEDDFPELQKYLVLNEPGFYVPVVNPYGWQVRYYRVRVPGCRVLAVSCRTGLPLGPVLLGHLGLCSIRDTHADDAQTNVAS